VVQWEGTPQNQNRKTAKMKKEGAIVNIKYISRGIKYIFTVILQSKGKK